MSKKFLRRALDGTLAALVVFQTSRAYVSPAVHLWAGVAFLACAALHLWLNRSWLKGLGRGRRSARRMLQAALAVGALICFGSLGLSAALLQGLIPGSMNLGREMHLVFSYGSLLVLGAHAGTHVWPRSLVVRAGMAAWAAYGALCFVALGIGGYLTLATPFAALSTAAPLPLHLFDHASVFVLAAVLGAAAARMCRTLDHRKREDHE